MFTSILLIVLLDTLHVGCCGVFIEGNLVNFWGIEITVLKIMAEA